MLSWDRETQSFAPFDNSGQPEWQRKERLYHEVNHHPYRTWNVHLTLIISCRS